MSDQPNILILMTDQHRWDCFGFAGIHPIPTPNFDRLAAEGVRFNRCYTSSPICMPTRSSFLSGLYPHNHGQWTNRGCLPEGSRTYAGVLRNAGYHTCHLGKSHYYNHRADEHTRDYLPYLDALGISEAIETTGPLATQRTGSPATDRWEKRGLWQVYKDDYARRGEVGPFDATWPSPLPEGEHLDDFVGRTAVEWLDSYNRDEPFCTFVGFGGPHDPWDPPIAYAEQFADVEPIPPIAWNGIDPSLPDAAREYAACFAGREVTPGQWTAIRRLYYAKVAHLDHWFGAILDALERRKMLDNTWLLFWSDHGERLCDRGAVHKVVFHDESARVPLIVRAPDGRGAGSVTRGLCETTDCMPTLLEMAGLDADDCIGASLLPALDDPGWSAHDAVLSEIHCQGPRSTMVRDDRYKMTVTADSDTVALFDMEKDPKELENLAGRPEMADTDARLRALLLDRLLQTPCVQ